MATYATKWRVFLAQKPAVGVSPPRVAVVAGDQVPEPLRQTAGKQGGKPSEDGAQPGHDALASSHAPEFAGWSSLVDMVTSAAYTETASWSSRARSIEPRRVAGGYLIGPSPTGGGPPGVAGTWAGWT